MKSILRCFISPYPIQSNRCYINLRWFKAFCADWKWFLVELSDFIDIIAFTLNLRNNLVKRVLVRVYCGVGFIVLFGLFLPCNRKDVGIVRNKENIGHGNGLTWSVVAAFINCCKHCQNIPFIVLSCIVPSFCIKLLLLCHCGWVKTQTYRVFF